MSEFLLYLSNHLLLFVFGICLFVIILLTKKIKKRDKYFLASIALCTMTLAIFEALETLFTDTTIHEENISRYIFSILSYILRPIIIVLFFHLRLGHLGKRKYILWIGVVINTIMYILAFFAYHNPDMRLVIWYYENNQFDRTWLGYTVYVICFIYAILLVVISFIDSKKNTSKRQIDYVILSTVILALIVEVLVITLQLSSSYTSEIFILGIYLYYSYLMFEMYKNDAVLHEREMQDKTTSLMLSQIQPHFIYNTLATIQVLCEIDAEKAAKTIDAFSKYLRINTDALSKREPVSILEEVKHAKTYSDIEMVRFDNVNVIFNIEDQDFKLPVLTLEPIVENAIKYGVRAKEEGIVEVRTFKEGNKHILVVKDNGIGFNMNEIKNDGRNHVGIENVKKRVENMVHGTFEIESEVGAGTTVTITVLEE